jgi:O-antigen ligase
MALVNFVIGAVLIFMTGSRGGFIALSAVVILLVFTRTVSIRLSYKVVFLLVVAIGAFYVNKVGMNVERFESIKNLDDDYNTFDETGRIAIWKSGLGMMLDHPFTGVGVGCFEEALGTEREKKGLPPMWQPAHNSLIQIGAETGIMGFILFGVASYQAFRIFGRAKRRALSKTVVKIAEMSRVGFVGSFVSGMFLTQAYSVYWAFYIAISAMVLSSLRLEALNEGNVSMLAEK